MTTASTSRTGPKTAAPGIDRPSVHTRAIETDADLLDLLPRGEDALAWVHDGDGIVGWGTAARLDTAGADRFVEAAEWWRDFLAEAEVSDEVGLPGTGPVAFVSMAFADRPGHSVVIVPEVLVGRRDGTTWVTEITEIGNRRRARHPAGVNSVRPVRVPSEVRYSEGELSVTGYRSAVAEAVRRLRHEELGKVVLAHDMMAVTPGAEGPVDSRYLLHGLAGRYPNCWAFAVDGLVGATPEMLLRRTGNSVFARVLAGTVWPKDGVDEDTLAASLIASAKDRVEHRYAAESLADTLRPFCTDLTVPAEPSVLRLPNVMHLATEVHGSLAGDPSLLELVGAAHPTAAVGGTPREEAVRLIAELERMDRGRYAGPVGWIDSGGGGEFGIALRCAMVAGNAVRMFAGCGIVADSDPDNEVLEANAKLVPMRQAIESGLESGFVGGRDRLS